MTTTTTNADQLRRLVRELIAELAPGLRPSTGGPVSGAAGGGAQSEFSSVTPTVPERPSSSVPPPEVSRSASPAPLLDLVVSVSNDTDLDALVSRIQRLCDDPSARTDLKAGRIRFRLAGTAEPSDPTPAIAAGRQRMTKQLVTERDVVAAHQAGATLVLAPRTLLTPLARDKAKALRVAVERER